jgi:aminoglycoside phosphotransferase (APT) family kinase protein
VLSRPDARVAERDRAIPGLALLLDPDAFATRLRTALPEAEVLTAKARYVRYKPGTSCLVAYRLDVGGAETDVYAKAVRSDDLVKLQKARYRLKVRGPLGPPGIILDDLAVVVYAFPNDQDLPTLARLADDERRRRMLAKALPDHCDLWDSTLHCLRYKPERRYVAQMLTRTGERALLKVYTEQDYRRAIQSPKRFVSRGPLRTALRLGRSHRRHMLILEWLPGRSLMEAMRHPSLETSVVPTVGAALAELHAQDPKALEQVTREHEAVSLLSVAVSVGAVCPHLASRTHDLALQLAAALLKAPPVCCPIHGDFSADQVLLTDGTVTILDLDTAVRGDPTVDLGSFAAQMHSDALRGDLPGGRVETWTQMLLEGYCAAAGCDPPAHFDLYLAAGLLHLAPHPFRNRDPNWPERTEAILTRAEAIAHRADAVGLRS